MPKITRANVIAARTLKALRASKGKKANPIVDAIAALDLHKLPKKDRKTK